jgi:hypothetical protein
VEGPQLEYLDHLRERPTTFVWSAQPTSSTMSITTLADFRKDGDQFGIASAAAATARSGITALFSMCCVKAGPTAWWRSCTA